MRPLRVLMLSVDPRVPGGVAEFIETLKSRLQHCDVIHVATGSMPGQRETALSVLRRLTVVPLRVAWMGLTGKFDVAHINGSLTPQCAVRDGLILLALLVARKQRIIVYIHGWRWTMARKMERQWFWRTLARCMLARADRILVLAPEFHASLLRMGFHPDRAILTRTMFDGATLLPPAAAPLPRRRILSLSRFEEEKNLFHLVRGFAQIAARYTDVDLVLAGDGSLLPAIRELVAELGLRDRVYLPGYVRGEAKARLLRDSAIFVLPSRAEGMPVALLEAMGAGLPVVVSKVGGIPHIVHEPQNGLLLTEVSPDTIGHALDELLACPDRCRQIGETNRRYAWERFEAGTVSAEIEGLYAAVAGQA